LKTNYSKEILQDPQDAKKSYENFILSKYTEFCCDGFKSYCKKFAGWDYSKGKFVIVNEITYEGNSTIPITFCPFCGEKIEYENAENPKKKRSEK